MRINIETVVYISVT